MAKPVKVVLTLDQSQFKKGMSSARGEIQKTEKAGTSAFGKMKTAFAAIAGAAAIQQIGSLADSYTSLQNRLRSVTSSQEEANQAFDLVRQVANSTRSDLGAVAGLFSDLTIATEEMGLSQKEVARISETFSKALKVSGADTNASAGAIRQFGQALASGVLRGDEFNSIMEANPAFMRNVAKTLGVTTGELRKMAEEGLLTSDILVTATEEISDTIDADFGKTVATLGESFQNIKNEVITLFGKIEEKTGIFSKLANLIKLVGENLNFVGAAIGFAFGSAAIGMIATAITQFNRVAKAIRGAAGAAAILQAVTGIGAVKALGGLAAGTAAYFAMEAAIGDTEEAAANLNQTLGDAPEVPDQTISIEGDTDGDGILSAKEKIALQEKITEEQKKQKKEATALTNEIARNKTKADELLETEKANLQNKIDAIKLETEMLGLSEKEKEQKREILDLEAERADALAEIQGMTFSKNEAENQAIIAEKLAEINDLYDTQIQKVEELTDAYDKASTEFDTGFMEAFENFREMVEDNAAYGARIFQTLSDGWTNAILDFVETGKLSFKDLFKSLMTEIIKMQANKLFLSLFGAGGVFGDLFAGFFAAGGRIPQGKFGIAGERGPEVVMGPATVVGTSQSADILAGAGGGASVSYTINAVDAPSFQQLVARDPSFIYNVVQVGARRQPR